MELINDTEAEQRVLSSMLQSESSCLEALDAINENDFADPFNRSVFLLIDSLFVRGIKPTHVELLKEGSTLGLINGLADVEKIKEVAEQFIDDENIKYWIGKVKEASKGRAVQTFLKKYAAQVETPEKIVIADLILRMNDELFRLSMSNASEKIDTAAEIAKLGSSLVDEKVERYRVLQEDCKTLGQVPLEGVPTGFPRLDSLTLGYKPGDLIILGAQTGHGKTAFALNTANAVCVQSDEKLLYLNTEMSKQQIAFRLGSILAGIPLQQIRSGSLTNEQVKEIKSAYQVLSKSGFYTSYLPNLTPGKLQNVSRKAKLQLRIKLLILDYVGRMDKIDPKLQEWQVLEQVVKSMKILAQNLEIAVMVLVQLNPDGSLQGAQRMKNETDLMLKLLPVDEEQASKIREYHHKKYESFNYRLFVDKARDSPGGIDIPLVFDKKRQQIREAMEGVDNWASLGRELDPSEIQK